jgi:putative copper resistance protein D
MIDPALWSTAIWIGHGLMYAAASGVIGGLFCQWLIHRSSTRQTSFSTFIQISAASGLLLGVGYFFLRVGEAADDGLAGFADPFLIDLLWTNSVGEAIRILLAGFGLALITPPLLRHIPYLGTVAGVLSIVALGAAFSLSGHTAEQPLITQIALAIHVIVALGWMGSLYPLWVITRIHRPDQACAPLALFGKVAPLPIALLVMAGAWISYQLTGWNHLLDSLYGNLLLLKGFGVLLLLGFGAWHKLRLVPRLLGARSSVTLQRSLLAEALVGVAVIFTTAALTGITGPHS